MVRERNPEDTPRAAAFDLWMQAPNPMVTFLKTLDVTNLVRVSRKGRGKFHTLLMYCVGKAAASIPEFYLLPVSGKLLEYDALAVNTIVRNRNGGISSCDVPFSDDWAAFRRDCLTYMARTAETCQDHDLSADHMVIGTSAVLETELDGAVGMNSGIFNNPFLIWGRYRRRLFRYELPISFQFHHTQMDGAHAGRFLETLQQEIRGLR